MVAEGVAHARPILLHGESRDVLFTCCACYLKVLVSAERRGVQRDIAACHRGFADLSVFPLLKHGTALTLGRIAGAISDPAAVILVGSLWAKPAAAQLTDAVEWVRSWHWGLSVDLSLILRGSFDSGGGSRQTDSGVGRWATWPQRLPPSASWRRRHRRQSLALGRYLSQKHEGRKRHTDDAMVFDGRHVRSRDE